MSDRFDGKVALVTGAGSGIGKAVALRLAADGARVLAVDVVEERLSETQAAAPDLIVGHVADIADPAACAAAVDAAVAAFGRLDVLANVAGIFHAGHFTDHTPEQYRRVLAVNLDGPYFLSQAAIPHLLETSATSSTSCPTRRSRVCRTRARTPRARVACCSSPEHWPSNTSSSRCASTPSHRRERAPTWR